MPAYDSSGNSLASAPLASGAPEASSYDERERTLLQWQVETLGQLAYGRAALTERPWEAAEREVLDDPVVLADGRALQWRIYRGGGADAEQYRALTAQVRAGRERRYTAEGHWSEDAVDDDFGPDTEILVLVDVDSDSGEETALASMRMTHRPIGELPGFMKAAEAGALSVEGLRLIADNSTYVAEDGTKRTCTFVELGALWKKPKVPIDVTTAMYRKAFHLSVIRRENWFAATVPKETAQVDMFGDQVVYHVGDPFEVHDGNARNGLMLTPIAIFTSRVLLGFAAQARAAEARGDHDGVRRNNALIARFARGLDPRHFDAETQAMLREKLYGHRKRITAA